MSVEHDLQLSECVLAYVGSPGVPGSPGREERVRQLAGGAAPQVLARITAIEQEIHTASPPLHASGDLPTIATAVREFVSARHPELTVAAVDALAQQATYDWR